MTDARTEARRRIASAVGPINPRDTGVFASAEEIADAVLALFPYVDWQPWCMSHAVAVQYADRSDCDGLGPHDEGRQLVLHGGIDDLAFPEPAVPGEPRATTPDRDLVLCSHRWDHNARRGGHMCVEFGPHTTHRCCCGAEEKADA